MTVEPAAPPGVLIDTKYRGRFAPSPTGPLHMGSLVAALASYLDARRHQGQWLVRIENLDPPREIVEASDWILGALDALGLHWDGEVLYQSDRSAAYDAALEQLTRDGHLFACRCTRQDLALSGSVYAGTCRNLHLDNTTDVALRCRVDDSVQGFHDRLQGYHAQQLDRDCGDFVVRRKDGLYAYQLAVVVDDAWQGITDVVRGADLLDSTPRQCYLQRLLNLPPMRYAHVPLLVDASLQKLSKQQHATPLDAGRPGPTLWKALELLRQRPPPELRNEEGPVVLQWGIAHWMPERLAGVVHVRYDE